MNGVLFHLYIQISRVVHIQQLIFATNTMIETLRRPFVASSRSLRLLPCSHLARHPSATTRRVAPALARDGSLNVHTRDDGASICARVRSLYSTLEREESKRHEITSVDRVRTEDASTRRFSRKLTIHRTIGRMRISGAGTAHDGEHDAGTDGADAADGRLHGHGDAAGRG